MANAQKRINIAELNAKLKVEMEKYGKEGLEMQDEQEEANRKKREEFKKKRAAHYNQFKLIQQAKQNKWQDEDDD